MVIANKRLSLMQAFPPLSDHPNVIFSWVLPRARTRPRLQSKCRKVTLRWGCTRRRTALCLNARPQRRCTVALKEPLRRQFEHGSTSISNLRTPLQEVINPVVTPSSGQHSFTAFGYEDYHLQLKKEFLRTKNVGIVIREESELNIMRKENQRNLQAKGKGKDNKKGKEKENQAPALPMVIKFIISQDAHVWVTLSRFSN